MRTHALPESRSSLTSYLGNIDRYNLMSSAQEARLARRYRRTGDPRAKKILITKNLRFVVKVASEYRSYGLSLDDLIQEGNIGLMRAVEKFDPERGNRLITYAVWWIRAYIQEFVLHSWSLVRLGTTQAQRKLFFSLARTKRELARAEASGQPPSAETVAERMGVTTAEVQAMEQRIDGRDLSLDAPRQNRDGSGHVESLPDHTPLQDDELAEAEEREQTRARVNRALSRLDPRERYIIERRFLGDQPSQFQEIGKTFGFSRERARQLEVRAKAKLRNELRAYARSSGIQTEAEAS
jgi:RNA polymerase sigma-32 factor